MQFHKAMITIKKNMGCLCCGASMHIYRLEIWLSVIDNNLKKKGEVKREASSFFFSQLFKMFKYTWRSVCAIKERYGPILIPRF